LTCQKDLQGTATDDELASLAGEGIAADEEVRRPSKTVTLRIVKARKTLEAGLS